MCAQMWSSLWSAEGPSGCELTACQKLVSQHPAIHLTNCMLHCCMSQHDSKPSTVHTDANGTPWHVFAECTSKKYLRCIERAPRGVSRDEYGGIGVAGGIAGIDDVAALQVVVLSLWKVCESAVQAQLHCTQLSHVRRPYIPVVRSCCKPASQGCTYVFCQGLAQCRLSLC